MVKKIYERKLTSILLNEIKQSRIVVLTGMRQVGKTTLMHRIFDEIKSDNKIFLDLENPLNRKIFEEKNYDNIIANLEHMGFHAGQKSFIFLDEVQSMPVIVKPIKYLYDHYKIKFFLTGSSSYYLKNLFPESLAGRKVIYELFPLDFEEYLVFMEKSKDTLKTFKKKEKGKNEVQFELYKKLYENYLEYGGFPAVVQEKNKARKRQILEDIFKSYFEKDVRTLTDFKELRKLRDLILLLANRVGSKIEISKIASEIGIVRDTVYSYLGFLEKTYFLFFLNPMSRSLNGEVRGAKKVYFCDTGLLNYLGRIPPGILYENAVFSNLRKYGNLNYYAKYKGPEIDFVLNKKIGLETKVKGNDFDVNRLKKISQSLGINEYYVVIKTYSDLPKTILAQDL